MIKIDDKELTILEILVGLEKEKKKVKQAFEKVKPDVLAVSLSPSGVDALGDEKIPVSKAEEVYLRKLARYGRVMVPCPSFLEARRLADKNDLPLVGIDLDDDTWAKELVAHVSTLQLIMYNFKLRRLQKKRFKEKKAAEFAKSFDRQLNSSKGFKHLQVARERAMAKNLLELPQKSVLAVLDLARARGVRKHLFSHRESLG